MLLRQLVIQSTRKKVLCKSIGVSSYFQYHISLSRQKWRYSTLIDEDVESIDALIRLRSARLGYPNVSDDNDNTDLFLNQPSNNRPSLNLSIQTSSKKAGGAGHALLGKNGCGKTLISSAISHYDNSHGGSSNVLNNANNNGQHQNGISNKNPYLIDGSIEYNQKWYQSFVSKVSFQSHSELLSNSDDIPTVYRALTPFGGRLDKATQYLVVRFGLYPLLHSPIHSISTGEIRKVLLVRALSFRPKVLILDNAFDGLDVSSRDKFKELVSKTLRGFRPDLLVQAVDAKNTEHTQVVLITHRAEEIVDGISSITMMRENIGASNAGSSDSGDTNLGFRTEHRNNRTGAQLLRSALSDFSGEDDQDNENIDAVEAERWNSIDYDTIWNDPSLPSGDEIDALWRGQVKNIIDKAGHNIQKLGNSSSSTTVIVEAKNLRVQRGDHVPISNLNWTVHKGQNWLIAGGNGAGKSTLSRLLAHMNNDGVDSNNASTATSYGITDGSLQIEKGANIGYVSTELHMSLTHSSEKARDVLTNKWNRPPSSTPLIPPSDDIVDAVARWLNISQNLLSNPFKNLSQGEQKLILIGAALTLSPSILILDEPCQGLDILSRRLVLGLVERICQSASTTTDMNLIYITHHMEELIPSVTNVLHLVEGRTVYIGDRHSYNPSIVIDT